MLRPYADQLVSGLGGFPPVSHYLGLLNTTLGQLDQAERVHELLGQALAAARELGLGTIEGRAVQLSASG